MPLIQRKRRAVSAPKHPSQEVRLTIASSNPKKKTMNPQTTLLSPRRRGEGIKPLQMMMHSMVMAAPKQTVAKTKW
jgi:hypothetical protein